MEENEVGYLIVNVRTARGAIPIEGAKVTVSRPNPDTQESQIISVMYTNQGGATEKLALPAPPKNLSGVPGNQNVYSVYNIESVKEGYFTVTNIFVPIFSGVTSIQPVEMIPYTKYETPTDEIFIDERNENQL